jgi:hypothetical protein
MTIALCIARLGFALPLELLDRLMQPCFVAWTRPLLPVLRLEQVDADEWANDMEEEGEGLPVETVVLCACIFGSFMQSECHMLLSYHCRHRPWCLEQWTNISLYWPDGGAKGGLCNIFMCDEEPNNRHVLERRLGDRDVLHAWASLVFGPYCRASSLKILECLLVCCTVPMTPFILSDVMSVGAQCLGEQLLDGEELLPESLRALAGPPVAIREDFGPRFRERQQFDAM